MKVVMIGEQGEGCWERGQASGLQSRAAGYWEVGDGDSGLAPRCNCQEPERCSKSLTSNPTSYPEEII